MSDRRNEPIAVVSSACRFAGDAHTPSKLWSILRAPTDVLSEIPLSRFNPDGFYHPDGSYHGHGNVRHAYLLNQDLGVFDAEFFGIKPVEAKAMDPQQRLLLEIVYEALEAAGMPVAEMKGSDTSVYVGVMFNDYGTMLLRDYQKMPTYYATGTGQSILSNRISHFFNWHGPSITVDTACSSSLVAVHMAVQSLRAGESRMALACGTNLIIGPEGFIIESKLNMLSPEGRSRMWDQGANGYARGEGVAAVVLKTLSAALEDGDRIECIIRETGLNQDGSTPGITMPSSKAQETLIRSTYAKAGLDLLKAGDRPQYFEAHGTGTPAGDPVEAEAVHRAFYTTTDGKELSEPLNLGDGHPLYVGSIKTVLGHTEGTAGVAALIKASLAMKHGVVPPNLLLNQLSDKVAPYYKNLEILRTAKPWPNAGGQRRVSVNSFGFGGTNAHIIVESWENSSRNHCSKAPVFIPFVFSAQSELSLRKTLSAYKDYLESIDLEKPNISPLDLAGTLYSHRTVFPYRVFFQAFSLGDLRARIEAKLDDKEVPIVDTKAFALNTRSNEPAPCKILGIFTGQGAQYARMGAELIEQSSTARSVIQKLESYLAQIPDEKCRPSWSLEAELLAEASVSRIHEPEFSQPLCTALQILLVDMMALAGVKFSAVVGHSSGEIAAAYAAGYLSARDAIWIAYYRGLYTNLAASPNGSDIAGAMIAVGSSWEDISELCDDDLFAGRLTVAASNSSSSVTVSGDEDAIAELEIVLDDEDTFHRRLKVNKAYHSSHMLPCVEPYVQSMQDIGIKPQTPAEGEGACIWYSSVHGGSRVDHNMAQGLRDTYWADNLTKPVLFSQALNKAIETDAYNLVLEVGPHPALKGPATQTINEILRKDLPYHGILARGSNAIEASSSALGFLWAHLDTKRINLPKYERAMLGIDDDVPLFELLKDLPTYQWNHETRHWHESRASNKMRLRSHVHPLLGDITTDSAPHHMSWRNLLKISEMEWLSGHAVQNQVVFPAAGYLSSALEASRLVVESIGKAETICLVEMHDFVIHQAVTFEQDDAGVEVLIEMSDILIERSHQASGAGKIRARFTYSAAWDAQAEDLVLAASADVVIQIGEVSLSYLPKGGPTLPHMITVEADRFYSALADLGYNFSGRFRALSDLQRKRGKSTCMIKKGAYDDSHNVSLLIHPAELDAMLQSAILAYSYPYDEELRTLHLPTKIKSIRINPAAFMPGVESKVTSDDFMQVEASIDFVGDRNSQWNATLGEERGINANINLFASKTKQHQNAAIQIQGAVFVPLGGSAVEEYRPVYSKVDWIPDQPDGIAAALGIWDGESQRAAVHLIERIATFYLRKFNDNVPLDHPARSEFTTKWYLNHARHVAESIASGRQEWWKPEWNHDTLDSLFEASKPYMHLPDVEIMHLVGKQMPRVFNGETTMLEEFRIAENDILDRYYAEGIGLKHLAVWVSRVIKQLVNRHPHMNVLEIGAGTGGATKAIFREIDDSFFSYTYTDISASFFETASSSFSEHKNKMIFQALDVEKDPVEQGFAEGSYDLVIAFFVIHATSDLENSLRNIRKLLKPGGFLILGEASESGVGAATSGFIFGTLPGWWVGTEKGRVETPLVPQTTWDHLLRSTGFSGAETAPPISIEGIFSVFPVISQAVDGFVNFLREPLSTGNTMQNAGISTVKKLLVIGGHTLHCNLLVDGLQKRLGGFAQEIQLFKTITDIDFEWCDADTVVLSLTELDSPVFRDITAERWDALKKLFQNDRLILWVTSGRLCDEPFSNMTVAFGRVANNETPGLRLQHFDIPDPEKTTSSTIAEAFLRFYAAASRDENCDIFWVNEHEIVIDSEHHQLVPRLNFIPELNDRYNAGRGAVVRSFDISSMRTPIVLESSQSKYMLRELSPYEAELSGKTGSHEDLLELRTMYATISALKTPFGHKFIILGVEPTTGVQHLALVPSLSSILKVSSNCSVKVEIPSVSGEDILRGIAAHLVSMTALDQLCEGQTLLVHNASQIVASALTLQAVEKGIDVVYTTDSTDETPSSWIQLPPYLSRLDLDETSILQDSPAAFIGLSNHNTKRSENEITLISSLGPQCHTVLTANSIYAPVASSYTSAGHAVSGTDPESRLRAAFGYMQQQLSKDTLESCSPNPAAESVSLDDLTRGLRPLDPLCIVRWIEETMLPVTKSRLDIGPIFKGSQSTYWIVGMSGALGIALADWMIRKGARSLVMSSRNPDISPDWVASHKRKGANIAILTCDVTDETSLQATHQHICNTMPPIVGVIHGAMVLRDASIQNMSFDQLTDAIRPKVNGCIYLDRIFRDINLDFFVLTSSINTIIGNLGQANYAAANAFMASMAAQRRKRGLRASVVNGGAIIGAGYMEREARRAWDKIAQNNFMMRLSEEDFVQSVCEAIHGSRLDSPYGAEISTGLNLVPSNVPHPPFWSSDPKFSKFILNGVITVENDRQAKTGTVHVQDLLQKCQSQEEVYQVIKHAFAGTLRTTLQVNMSDDDLMAAHSSEIGIDSLVSVNIRSWFLKHLQVGIPVLKIMSNDNMGNLVQIAVDTIPPELVPQLHRDGEESSKLDTSYDSPSTPTQATSQTPLTEADSPPRDSQIYKGSIASTGIDWEVESRPPADLANIPLFSALLAPVMPPRRIVLTGAGGLLGHHLLNYLLEHTAAEKIFCIALRNVAARLKNDELPQPSSRIEYYEGDLAAPLLGLNSEQASTIFGTADVVIHNGADTSHMKGYRDLWETNVNSTITLTRLCLPRRVPFHYISSVGLAILYGQDSFPPVKVTGPNSALPAPDGSFGYASAKWTCERFLERTHEMYGGFWDVCIHRPSTIIRDGTDAVGKKADLDWLNAMISHAKASKTVPEIHRNHGALDLVLVENVCADITEHVVHKDERMKRGEVSYVHEVGDVVIPLDRLQDIGLQEPEGKQFDLLPMDEWISNAMEAGLHPAIAALIELIDEPGGPTYPRLLKDVPV